MIYQAKIRFNFSADNFSLWNLKLSELISFKITFCSLYTEGPQCQPYNQSQKAARCWWSKVLFDQSDNIITVPIKQGRHHHSDVVKLDDKHPFTEEECWPFWPAITHYDVYLHYFLEYF